MRKSSELMDCIRQLTRIRILLMSIFIVKPYYCANRLKLNPLEMKKLRVGTEVKFGAFRLNLIITLHNLKILKKVLLGRIIAFFRLAHSTLTGR